MSKQNQEVLKLRLEIDRLEALISNLPTEHQETLKPQLESLKNVAKDTGEAVRLAKVCYVYGSNPDNIEHFKRLFYCSLKKIYITAS